MKEQLSHPDTKHNTGEIKKRAIFFIGGFDPKSPHAFFDRLGRETKRFEELWQIEVKDTKTEQLNSDVTLTSFTSKSTKKKPNWSLTTDFHFLTLDDIVLKDFGRPLHTRLWNYAKTAADYISTGTAFRFIKYAWRFSLYFFYPLVMFLIALAIAWIPAHFMLASMSPLNRLSAPLLFIITLLLLLKLGGNRYHVFHLMDLWSFSHNYLIKNRQDIEIKLDSFADLIATRIQSQNYDEILLIGHSTGGALILDTAGRLSERHPKINNSKYSVGILTLGSTALKIGLHPKAGWFRERLNRLFKNQNYFWVEYQCLTDIINFYNTDPAELMEIDAQPMILPIRVKDMIGAKTYSRIKLNFFRVHYQFIFGNTHPNYFDYPGLCFGPAPLYYRASNPIAFLENLEGLPRIVKS